MDWTALPMGGLVAGTVHDVRDYGVLCDLEGHPDIVALVSPGQARTPALPQRPMLLDILLCLKSHATGVCSRGDASLACMRVGFTSYFSCNAF